MYCWQFYVARSLVKGRKEKSVYSEFIYFWQIKKYTKIMFVKFWNYNVTECSCKF